MMNSKLKHTLAAVAFDGVCGRGPVRRTGMTRSSPRSTATTSRRRKSRWRPTICRPQLEQVPANLRFAFVVEYLIERHLLAQEALKSQITESDEYKRRLKFYQAKALRDAYFTDELAPSVS
jgi:hypothetical protein